MKFSANLGFLWIDLSLPDAIRAAGAAGFDAVELHWPFDTPAADVHEALADAGIPALGLNTRRGNLAAGERGLAAVPGREEEARALIDEALGYATLIGCDAVHVMSGNTDDTAAQATLVENLRYASAKAEPENITVLIEPMNRHDAPDYFLRTTDQARGIIEAVKRSNVKMMFDCYHVARTEGDVVTRLEDLLPIIGHFQFASVPDRGTPDHGELNYGAVFGAIEELGWTRPLGAEYQPEGLVEDSLCWMSAHR